MAYLFSFNGQITAWLHRVKQYFWEIYQLQIEVYMQSTVL